MKVWYAHKNGTPLLDHWFPMCAAERFVSFTDHQAALDEVLKDAVWAMEYVSGIIYDRAIWHADKDPNYRRANAFLASQAVQDYLKRQKEHP